jgi:hypothetical protein
MSTFRSAPQVVQTTHLRRLEDWTEPDYVDSETLQVIGLADDTRQITESISVRITEGANNQHARPQLSDHM